MVKALACLLAAFATAVSLPAAAGAATAGFQVRVALALPGSGVPPGTGPGPDFCRLENAPGAFGAILTVVCRTGVVVELSPAPGARGWSPIHGGAYRFLPPVSHAGVLSAESNFQTGLGTVTSWRVVNLHDRDYLEMTVRW